MAAGFYVAALVAVVATIMVIINSGAVHALLHLIVSLLAVAVVFYVLGAPFAAALEVIVYAGAIMVLFSFVVMMLNIEQSRTHDLLSPRTWVMPGALAAILLAELLSMLWRGGDGEPAVTLVDPRKVGALLFGPYLLAVELASILLLAGLVAAYHLARPEGHSAKAKEGTRS